MANLHVRDLDNSIYEAVKTIAQKEHRSISQEVIVMIESYLGNPKQTSAAEATEEFLNLSWQGDESADKIIDSIRKSPPRLG